MGKHRPIAKSAISRHKPGMKRMAPLGRAKGRSRTDAVIGQPDTSPRGGCGT
jgi:hypothetical protein